MIQTTSNIEKLGNIFADTAKEAANSIPLDSIDTEYLEEAQRRV